MRAKKPKWLIVASNVRHNLAAKWALFRGRIESDIGSTHRDWPTEHSVRYIEMVFRSYLDYGGLTVRDIQDKRILELGPGDNLGVAALLYAAGASQVVCLDKFFSRRDTSQQLAIYRSLRAGLPNRERERFDLAVQVDGDVRIDEGCILYVPGVAAERAAEMFGPQAFDLIVSRAVLWEIFDIDQALEALDRVLRAGGRMVHKIACIDWVFRQNGYHPLEFLTVSDPVYRWLARDSGKSNRRTIDYYRTAMKRLGYEAVFHITRVVGASAEEFSPGVGKLVRGVHYDDSQLRSIHEIRPRLLPRFRSLSDDDLLVEDMFLVATKQDASTSSVQLARG